jgi:hypothetical protein
MRTEDDLRHSLSRPLRLPAKIAEVIDEAAKEALSKVTDQVA